MNNPYTFEKDDLQWTLVKRGVKGEKAKKPGDESVKTIGYYPKLEIAARAMHERLIRDNCPESPTLEQILAAIPLATQQVVDAVKATQGAKA